MRGREGGGEQIPQGADACSHVCTARRIVCLNRKTLCRVAPHCDTIQCPRCALVDPSRCCQGCHAAPVSGCDRWQVGDDMSSPLACARHQGIVATRAISSRACPYRVATTYRVYIYIYIYA